MRAQPSSFALPVKASLSHRGSAFVVDAAVVVLTGLGILYLAGGALGEGGVALWTVFGSIGTLLYKPVAEAINGKTVGKRLLDVKVVHASTGGVPSLQQTIVRFIVLYVATPVACGMVALLNERRRGLHDLLAGTAVVRG